MWGGVKPRRHYGDLFRQWSAGKGLDDLRHKLYQEPRPWYLAYSLHQHRHQLQDYHCGRLLSWCTSIFRLEKEPTRKLEAYRYAQETFHMLVNSHKAGREALAEYMRLCAEGKDLTMAFQWYQFWLESKREGSESLEPLIWLLRIAQLSPSDECAEDMVEAVKEGYISRFCSVVENENTQERALSHWQPPTEEGKRQLVLLFGAFQLLLPRVQSVELHTFISQLPVSREEHVKQVSEGWPTRSHHHTFPHLEAGVSIPLTTVQRPALCDSLLHPKLVRELEEAAFSHDIAAVVQLMHEYKENIQMEAQRKRTGSTHTAPRRGGRDIWRQYLDTTAVCYRKEMLEESSGLTAELYHYLVVALSPLQPSAALRTLQRMKEAGLHVLDITRTVVLVHCEGSPTDQLQLFREQVEEIERRKKLDDDFGITKAVELYWKFQYCGFLHYRNALDYEPFYEMLLDGLGPRRVQELILADGRHGVSVPRDDLIVMDEPWRRASARYFRRVLGDVAVQSALDTITMDMPKLDISLIGAVPHFDSYVVAETEEIATHTRALQALLEGFEQVYVLDTSFVETSEAFVKIGCATGVEGRTLVLVPFITLAQLSTSVFQTGTLVSLDPALQESIQSEPFRASQRLRALSAMVSHSVSQGTRRVVRVLHFSECLLAHMVPRETIERLHLRPDTADNDHLLLVMSMLRALAPQKTQLTLCTDDADLKRMASRDTLAELFEPAINILSSQPPDDVDVEKGLINDNPLLVYDETFQPQLNTPSERRGMVTDVNAHVGGPLPPPLETVEEMSSPWLSMLEEAAGKEIEGRASVAVTADTSSTTTLTTLVEKDLSTDEHTEKLMQLYQSPHDPLPVAVKMENASALTGIFDEFDVMEPDQRAVAEEAKAARRSELSQTGAAPHRRRTLLEKEMLTHRGLSNKERFRLARRLSNQSGGRVPFNFRYRVVEANINDPRNAHFRRAYEEGLQKKRHIAKRTLMK